MLKTEITLPTKGLTPTQLDYLRWIFETAEIAIHDSEEFDGFDRIGFEVQFPHRGKGDFVVTGNVDQFWELTHGWLFEDLLPMLGRGQLEKRMDNAKPGDSVADNDAPHPSTVKACEKLWERIRG